MYNQKIFKSGSDPQYFNCPFSFINFTTGSSSKCMWFYHQGRSIFGQYCLSTLITLHVAIYTRLLNPLLVLKVDMPILTCIFFTFNWLTLTSEMHFVKFHPVVASCLLSRGKRKYAPLGMRLLWKYIRNYFLVYQLISPFLVYLQNYKEFEAEILDLQSEKYGLSFDIKKYTTSGWALGDENVIGIRAFKVLYIQLMLQICQITPWLQNKTYLVIGFGKQHCLAIQYHLVLFYDNFSSNK